MRRPVVLVGVGGTSGWEALAWAVDEAARRGGAVLAVHACQPDSPLAGTGERVAPGVLEIADPALSRAIAAARTRLGGDRVTLRVLPGEPAAVVLDAAGECDMVVMGAPTGHAATVHQIVTQSPCPTVVVRPVPAGRERPFAGHVVVGVCENRAARAALEFGFEYAAAHRLPLAAVHVSDDEDAGDRLLAEEVEPWSHKYPEVKVGHAVLTGRPLTGLVGAAEGARLLVVGDRGHGVAARLLLGSVSHGAVDRAGCPVAVVRTDECHRRFR